MRQVVLLQCVFMMFVLSLFASKLSAQSVTNITTCDDVIFDNGGEFYPYSEDLDGNAGQEVTKICPTDPSSEVIKLIWKSFDVAPGDVLNAYNGGSTSSGLINSAMGTGTGSGPSIADSPGGGWVISDHTTGCITLEFLSNGDGTKGAGWEIWVTCEERDPEDNPELDCPSSGIVEVAHCFNGLAHVEIPVPTYGTGTEDFPLDVTSDCAIADLPTEVMGNGDPIVLDLPIGIYEITYQSQIYDNLICKVIVRVVAPPLACNNDLNVSLDDQCSVILTPDLLLENRCHEYGYGYGDHDGDAHHEGAFTYHISLPNLPGNISVLDYTEDGYPIIDFSQVSCGATYTFHISRTYEQDSDCDGDIDDDDDPVVDQCTGWVTLQDPIAPYIYDNDLDEYEIYCYQDDGSLLTTLNENASGEGAVTIEGPGDVEFDIQALSSAFTVLDNCGYDYVVSDWMVVNVDCTANRFEGWDPDGNGIADDVLWDIMAIEFGDPSTFRKYFRRIQVVDRCGNTSGLVVQCINVIQPDIVAPVLDVELPCGTDIDPLAMYEEWANGTHPEFAYYLPSYDKTPLIVNLGDIDLGSLEDMTFTNASGDEVPAQLEHASCGYAIDWIYGNPIPVCHEPGNPTGGTYKIFRDWTIYNWCDGHLEYIDVIPQVIKVGDLTPPEIGADIHFSVTGNAYYDCSVDLLVQIPTISDNCSNTMANAYVVATYANGQQSLSYSFETNGIARIPNLPIGTVSIDLFATDVCGNSGSRSYEYDVYDVIPPVAICEDLHTVSLGANCEVEVPAIVFDDGSYDNCGITKFLVARLDSDSDGDGLPELEDFSDRIWFSQDDLASGCEGTVSVVLRVSDESFYDLDYDGVIDHGPNVNYCTVTAKIQDRIAPVVAPAFKTEVACGSPFLTALGSIRNAANQATALQEVLANYPEFAPTDVSLGNCQGETNLIVLTMDFIGETSTCKDGVLTYTYRASDACGNTSNVGTATVNVVGESTWEMHFPVDYQVFCAADGGSVPAAATITEILDNKGCDFWAMEVVEEEFSGADGNCAKVIRTYKFLNWCTWNPSNTETAVVERPSGLILDAAGTVALRYLDEDEDNVNDIDDGNEDNDNRTLFNPATGDIRDANEARIYDEYDVTTLDNDGDFVVIDYNDTPYQNISYYNAVSSFSGVEETYVSAQHYGSMQYRQIIKISDATSPEIVINQDGPFCSTAGGNGVACRANVSITFTVSDACSSNIDVAYRLRPYGGATLGDYSQSDADFFPSGSPLGGSLTNNGDGSYTISGVYPLADNGMPANHHFDIVATDGCGNSVQESTTVEVKDCTAPVAYCIFGISTDLDTEGKVLLWASDFDAGSYDECTPQDQLILSFADPALYPDSTFRTFSCFNGEVGVVEVEIWVQDLAGNVSRCETFINIQENQSNNGCPSDNADGAAAIVGQVSTESGAAIEQVEVALSGNMSSTAMTSVSGNYTFASLEQGYDYTITPQSNAGPLNGVSTFDLVLMSKHILGIELLDSPYKLIAADVNNSATITTFDLVILRKLILNIETEFTNNTSWRFVDSNYSFPNPANPWEGTFPEVMSVNNLEGQHIDTDFVGIKVGDVNGSAANSIQGRNAANDMNLQVRNQVLEAGETYTIAFNTTTAVEGYQFTLEFDNTKLDLVDVEEGIAKGEHFGLKHAADGILTASWNNTSVDATASDLFSLTFNVLEDVNLSDALELTSNYTASEAYATSGELLNVALEFDDAATAYELYQNVPNPFKDITMIGFNLANDENVQLRIYDVAGKTLQIIKRSFSAGYNEIAIESKDLPQAGVLYYTLEAGDFKATRKMVIIE